MMEQVSKCNRQEYIGEFQLVYSGIGVMDGVHKSPSLLMKVMLDGNYASLDALESAARREVVRRINGFNHYTESSCVQIQAELIGNLQPA